MAHKSLIDRYIKGKYGIEDEIKRGVYYIKIRYLLQEKNKRLVGKKLKYSRQALDLRTIPTSYGFPLEAGPFKAPTALLEREITKESLYELAAKSLMESIESKQLEKVV